jgi:molybdenum cofactor cytidylyltransferase
MNISAVIMASGLSRRMTKNKLYLEINKKKIYEYILLTVKQCSFYEVIVVAKDEDIIQSAVFMGFKAIRNNRSYLGQSVSIRLALENSSDSNGFIFFVADQPFIKVNTILKLCEIFKNNPNKIIIPSLNDSNKNPVIFPSYLKEELMNIEGDRGGKVVIKNNLENALKVNLENEDEFFDIDTLDDYRKAIEMKTNL